MALTDNLVAFWELEESSGTRQDAIGSHHLTSHNSVAGAAGRVGTAADLVSASQQYLSVADAVALSGADIDFTIQAWVYLSSLDSNRMIMARWSSPYEWALYYDGTAEMFRFGISGTGGAPFGLVSALAHGAAAANTWHLVHAWHDAVNDEVGLAVDAGTANTTSWAGGCSDQGIPLYLGLDSVSDGSYFNGRLDQAGVWRGRVLTSLERTELYNGGAGLSYAAMSGVGSDPAAWHVPTWAAPAYVSVSWSTPEWRAR